jgi:tetratricopeptide (TPR) repeat protein
MQGVPGDLHEEPFVDFATTRNRALDLCGARSEFVIWLDADDVLEGGAELRAFLEAERGRDDPSGEAYYVRVEVPGASFDSARVVRASAGWRFRGAVHEVLSRADRPPPTRRVADVRIRHLADARSVARSKARWERDVGLLEREVAGSPRATRPAFYLAMTLLWLGRHREAIAAFDRRIALGGWSEEVFQARFSKARAAELAGDPWPQVLALYLEAHAQSPHRAEPLHQIALHYDRTNEHALALLFARRAYELPFPSGDSLFVDEDVYRWRSADLVGTHAYWLGEFVLGEAAARQAVRNGPPDPRLARNLAFYEGRKGSAT